MSLSPDAVYLDAAATTPLDPEVLAAMLPYLREQFGNPGSLHRLGAAAARAVEEAREAVAAALLCAPREVVFTSGGTEANALALSGALLAGRARPRHVVTSAVEHPCVQEQLALLAQREGVRVTRVPVGPDGTLDPQAVLAALEPETALVSLMQVQNETGALFPVEAIARAVKARRPDVLVHVDGVQGCGKLPPPGPEVDLYAISAHKLHGPKGAGALRVGPKVRLAPLVPGGGQERGLRGGTEAVPALVGLGVAVHLAAARRVAWAAEAAALGARLRTGLLALGAALNSPPDGLPSLVNASFVGAPAEPLLHALEAREVYVSTGSACAARQRKKSPTLQAMGLPAARIDGALRFSFGRGVDAPAIERALAALAEALSELGWSAPTPAGGERVPC